MEHLLDGRVLLHCGDCRAVLATLAPDSIDAVVTDPPYALGFMGKTWDHAVVAFDPATWAAVFRVLKPGGHLLAMGGTRTFHRLACAIEDAGFEIRDTVAYLYGSGFPKSLAVNRSPMFCQCAAIERNGAYKGREHSQDARNGKAAGAFGDDLPLKDDRHSFGTASDFQADCPQDHGLDGGQPHPFEGDGRVSVPSQQDALGHSRSFALDDATDHGSARNPYPAQHNDHLSNRDCSCPEHFANEAQGCISSNTSPADICGSDDYRLDKGQGLSYANGLPRCRECGKPIADGLGTALKPAMELCVLARKPLSEGTVAANVLRWGTGAINVDGCRVGTSKDVPASPCTQDSHIYGKGASLTNGSTPGFDPNVGRWPANLLHDGSDEVTAAFPDVHGAGHARDAIRECEPTGKIIYSHSGDGQRFGDSGSAARFFYTAKADADDRLGSKHPTVKPLDLMQWLVRLVTPKGGTVLDPFAGTGTTGEAAWREGAHAVLIEAEAEYQADIRRRMALALAGPDERSRESVKAKGLPRDDGPLFAGEAAWRQMWAKPFDFSQEPD